jgi:D-sedoheptulose 7-phosphate isomerase
MVQAADRVQNAFAESIRVKQATALECGEMIAAVSERLVECFGSGGKAILFGNGGSAADAQHIASEWVGRHGIDRRALPAIALTANSSEFTAIGNDYGFDHVFARGIEAHGRPGDIAVGISTSGDSANVLAAIDTARNLGLITVGLLGKGGGKIASAVDYPITVPSFETPRIQESHITIGHILCELVEASLFPELFPELSSGTTNS